ncbi:hypothetical protein [Vitreimonas sp.]|uniref:hypothetical protein n=1 Tax=Vitreimonas sp. TaxID=3069702 RepID=UPI002EDB0325
MTYQYSFKDCLQRSERIQWRVEDIIGGDKRLDFSRPFMPESFARTADLDFLSEAEKLTLNHIRGHAYLSLFGVIEEFILPFVLDHARPLIITPLLEGDNYKARAFLEFANEEAKHIHLFRCFREEFLRNFGTRCDVIGPPDAIGKHVLSKPALAVSLLTLQIEWMTQRHFTDAMKDDASLDPQFKSLLLHHWMEEHQHAQLDALMTLSIAERLSAAEIDAGIEAYLELGAFFDEGVKQQTLLDLDALQRATGRTLSDAERARFLAQQHQANRWTYLGSGMSHPRFLETLGQISPARRDQVEAAAPAFS